MNNTRPNTSLTLIERLSAELKLKLILAVALNLWIFVPYQFLQRHHYFPTTIMSASFLDRLIRFSDRAVWVYLSIYLLMPIVPFLMSDRQRIVRYALGIFLIGALADLVFVFWPTSCPRPDPTGTTAAYRMLTTFDNPYHAFPSLHAAFAVYSALCAGQVLREMRNGALWLGAVWVWAGLILFATLVTKQHMAADVVGGIVLAFGTYVCVFHQRHLSLKVRTPGQPVTASSMEQNSTAL